MGIEYTPLLITGQVLSTAGAPLPNVLLDWWQADTNGTYYHSRYRLRGTLRTDADGRFECLTVSPHEYGMGGLVRTAHLHVIFAAPGGERVTTQLYICNANNPKEMNNDLYVVSIRLYFMHAC